MKHIYYILFALLPLLVFGQERIPLHPVWNGMEVQQTVKNLEIHTISFENSITKYRYGALPVFTAEINLPPEWHACVLNFDSIVFDTLQTYKLTDLTDGEFLQDTLLWHVEYEEQTARIFVVPMISEEDIISLIKGLTITVNHVPADVPKNSESREVFYADNSVLRTGDWYKIGVVQTGVHKITYENMQSMGIDPASLDVSKIGLFGTYSGMLNESNFVSRPDDLTENAIYIEGADDNSFDRDDYILFHAQAPRVWWYNMFSARFEHRNNLFSDTVYYFLTTDRGNGKRITDSESSTQQPTVEVNEFVDYGVHDKDLENLILSGKEWFGERLTGDTLERTYSFQFPNHNTDKPLYLQVDLATRSFINTYYQIFVNGELLIDSVKVTKVSANGGLYARSSSQIITFFSDSDAVEVTVKYLTDDLTSITWVNFVALNAERHLRYTGNQMTFRNPTSAAAGNISRFNLSQTDGNEVIWNITDRHNPVNIEYLYENGTSYFVLPTDSLLEFIVFNHSDAYSPVSFGKIPNQNLHAMANIDMVIVSYPGFLEQANRLAALHETMDGMQVAVVTPGQIYNEFSSGSQDIAAIRDFMRMLYVRGSFEEEYQSGYLLLFGDASYDYKYRVHDNTNFVPTYESDESLRLTGSYVTDDFFGLLGDRDGLNCVGDLDIGIGRLPVATPEEAKMAVDKIEHYLSQSRKVMRDWRNVLCFIADDGDVNLHMHQAKQLVDIADTLHPGIRINKIFSDAFTKIVVPGGKRYPEVNALINEQVEKGALMLNYTGHGGLIGWSKSYILDMPMIHSFDNYDNLPLFVTATCEFSRYDDPEFISAGEYVFLNEHGGGIALLTTTRLAYAHANIVVNRRIYEHLMTKKNNMLPRLGDLVQLSKIPSDNNFLNFVLLGDPALRLAYPQFDVVTTTVNTHPVSDVVDTIRALQTVIVVGKVVNDDGTIADWFNGYAYPKVYDKATRYSTQGNDGSSYPEEFLLSDKLLFDGKATVIDGYFSFEFLVPKDINYSFGFGSIKYYALDTVSYSDAWGGYDQLFIGGYNEQADPDDQGPVIQLYLEDKSFISGDITSADPLVFAEIYDDKGISFTGLGLGRDLVMVVDNDFANSIIMNDYFEINTDSYQQGTISYQLNNLAPGKHTLSLKAWDLHNNSSEVVVDFYVNEQADIELSGVLNYPNPFTETTRFTFIQNKSNTELDVEIRIFDISGRWITTLNEQVRTSGIRVDPIEWDGRNSNGNKVDAGVYMYQIIVTDQLGNTAAQRQKFIKIN